MFLISIVHSAILLLSSHLLFPIESTIQTSYVMDFDYDKNIRPSKNIKECTNHNPLHEIRK